MKLACLEHRKSTGPTTSSTWAKRPAGISSTSSSRRPGWSSEVLARELRVHVAGRDGVDCHAVRGVLVGHHAHELVDGALRRRIRAVVLDARCAPPPTRRTPPARGGARASRAAPPWRCRRRSSSSRRRCRPSRRPCTSSIALRRLMPTLWTNTSSRRPAAAPACAMAARAWPGRGGRPRCGRRACTSITATAAPSPAEPVRQRGAEPAGPAGDHHALILQAEPAHVAKVYSVQ